MDGSDINSCDVSTWKHKDGYHLLASGDDFGKVNIYRAPSMLEGSQPVVLKGHCSHVTGVKFGQEGMLYSVGGNDTTVIQWKIDML